MHQYTQNFSLGKKGAYFSACPVDINSSPARPLREANKLNNEPIGEESLTHQTLDEPKSV